MLLAGVVVVLTRVRMASQDHEGAGRAAISPITLNIHTSAGAIAIVLMGVYLATTQLVVGWVSMGIFWVTTLAGLALLARWMPASGRHSTAPKTDTWGEGPGLSILAHVGMLIGVTIITVFLGMGKI